MESEIFHYSYSAADQEEIKKIREKYLPAQNNKLEQLRRLDASVTKKGTIISICIGILGTLIFGIGMTMCLVKTETLLIPGIVVGLLGIAFLAAAYPLYVRITARQREKLAPEILQLTEDLLK